MAAEEGVTISDAAVDAEGDAPVKDEGPMASKMEEEDADFGDVEAAPAGPQRALPDYGDLTDEADGSGTAVTMDLRHVGNSKRMFADPSAAPRPDTVHLLGANRLTRGHIEELFAAKDLPGFKTLEWIGDERVLCIFHTSQDAATSLTGVNGSWDGVDEDGPHRGPGVWRARRKMLEFRLATTDDKAPLGWRRNHRGGKQVREFRTWSAFQEVDEERQEQRKRLHEQLEEFDRWAEGEGPWPGPAKRRRLYEGAGSGPTAYPPGYSKDEGSDEEGGPDLLDMMAKQDKSILAKEEDTSESVAWPQQGFGGGFADQLRGGGSGGAGWWEDRWQDGSDADWGADGRHRGRGGSNWQRGDQGDGSWGRGGDGGGGKGGRRATGTSNRFAGDPGSQGRGAKSTAIESLALDEEERLRRKRRQDRFSAPGK